MATKVIMPQMGESIFEGTITKWLKKVGDKIQRDEPLFEISTDKVDSEIPAPASGVLSEILVPEGQTVQINTVVAVIDGEGAERQAASAPAAEPGPRTPPPAPDQKAPATPSDKAPAAPSDKASGGTGDKPPAAPEQEEGQPSDEATVSAPEPEVQAQEGPPASRPQPVPTAEPRSRSEEPPRPAAPPKATAAPAQPPQEMRASPLVRRLAREHDLDLSALQGTGLGGRITKQDVLSYIDQQGTEGSAPSGERTAPAAEAPAAAPAESPAAAPRGPEPQGTPQPSPPAPAAPSAGRPPEPPRAAPSQPAVSFTGETETVPMTPMRKAISEHMILSRKTSAHVTTVFEVNMGAVVALRERMKASFEAREGVKLTLTPFLAKALINTVREFPILNCSLVGDNIVYKRAVNLGVAVALETGLIVPVVREAHLKSFTGLALAIADLAERARTKKLRPDDVQGGTITITNPGVYGGLFATPIINQPQVAIMGVGGLEKRPVVIGDAIAIRPMIYLSLSFDHRVVDGAVADQAMARCKALLESWAEWVD